MNKSEDDFRKTKIAKTHQNSRLSRDKIKQKIYFGNANWISSEIFKFSKFESIYFFYVCKYIQRKSHNVITVNVSRCYCYHSVNVIILIRTKVNTIKRLLHYKFWLWFFLKNHLRVRRLRLVNIVVANSFTWTFFWRLI